MNKKAIIILFLVLTALFNHSLCAQDSAYLGHRDFLDGYPYLQAEFKFTVRDIDPYFHRVSSVEAQAHSDANSKVIWGIMKDSKLYLNADRMGMKKGYVQVIMLGTYSYFIGSPVYTKNEKLKVVKEDKAAMMDFLGVPDNSNDVLREKSDDMHYIMNMQTGVPHVVDKEYVVFVLKDYPDLLSQFNAEEASEKLKVQLHYIQLVNKELSF